MIVLRTRIRRLYALCRKETLQILRDPSTLLIAVAFPIILVAIFGAGINLDSSTVRLGVVSEDGSTSARRWVETLASSPSFRVIEGTSVDQMTNLVRAGRVSGFVVVRDDFAARALHADTSGSSLLLVTDGAEPNTASFVAAYVRGAYGVWLREELRRQGRPVPAQLTLEDRAWFNPSTKSRNYLLPGSITLIMTVVGALLTALVVAREWERGTMEALLAAGVTRFELLACKLIPYFFLGLVAFGVCVIETVWVFEVPLRGSIPVLLLVGSTFLGSALGLGLLLSTVLRSQFNAAQAALNAAFLPAMMLSGFVFEIRSMPWPIRAVTTIIPARYFVSALQSLFQAGDVWSILRPALLGLCLASAGFIGLAFRATRRRLE